MTVGKEDLVKKANELELDESQKCITDVEKISALGELLDDVYITGRPAQLDYNNRRDLVRIFNEITREIFGRSSNTPVVEEYGSFVMDIFSAKSDLDLSVNLVSNPVDLKRDKKIQMLRRFAKKFYAMQRNGHVSRVQPILSAKVPILKLVDSGTGIECDISIENRDGIAKSQIVRMVSSIDSRFQMLSFLMKAWAKAHHINSSFEHTLNSLSIISLVAFHLQTRDPPILPPFSAIMKGGTDPMSVGKEVASFLNYGKENKESLGDLFVSLLIKLASVQTLWDQGLCASAYEGSWILKDFGPKLGCVKVEDFTDRNQNISRATRSKDLEKIYTCINLSIESVSAFMEGKIGRTELRELLFGQTLAPADVSIVPIPILTSGTAETSLSVEPKPKKKKNKKKNKQSAVVPVDPKGAEDKSVSTVPAADLKRGTAESSTSNAPKPKKKKMRPAVPVPPVNPKPVAPPVVSLSEGRAGIPPVNLGRTTPVGPPPPRVWCGDLPTEGRVPVGFGTGTPLANWGGIAPDMMATIISLSGIPRAGWEGPPFNSWGRTAAGGFIGAPGVGHHGGFIPTVARGVAPQNLGRPPMEGLNGTLGGVGQYGGPTVGQGVAPWGGPPRQGFVGVPGVGQYGGPAVAGGVIPSEDWVRAPSEGLGGTPGFGWRNMQENFVPDYIRRGEAYPRR